MSYVIIVFGVNIEIGFIVGGLAGGSFCIPKMNIVPRYFFLSAVLFCYHLINHLIEFLGSQFRKPTYSCEVSSYA